MSLFLALLESLGELSFCAPEEFDSNGTLASRRVALPRLLKERTITAPPRRIEKVIDRISAKRRNEFGV